MNRLIKLIPLAVLLCIQAYQGSAQNYESAFIIGESNDHYHELINAHPTSLLEVCDNSMEESYKTWSSVLSDIESYCMENGFDIRGSKLWINVFWNSDGTIANIVFHPKPNSKNIDVEILRKHLSNFVDESYQGKSYETNYSHYGSASFPVYYASQIIEK